MKKLFPIVLGAVVAVGLSLAVARAQTGEPGIDLPIFSATATATPDNSFVTYTTVTPVPALTLTATSSEYIDDAETGSEIYALAFLSLIAGMGLFFIKKYLDVRKYSI